MLLPLLLRRLGLLLLRCRGRRRFAVTAVASQWQSALDVVRGVLLFIVLVLVHVVLVHVMLVGIFVVVIVVAALLARAFEVMMRDVVSYLLCGMLSRSCGCGPLQQTKITEQVGRSDSHLKDSEAGAAAQGCQG